MSFRAARCTLMTPNGVTTSPRRRCGSCSRRSASCSRARRVDSRAKAIASGFARWWPAGRHSARRCARWVTPPQLRRRFDARFFLARLPAGQDVRPQEGEVAEWLWITPEQALGDPKITLVYATRTVLESVATGEDSAA